MEHSLTVLILIPLVIALAAFVQGSIGFGYAIVALSIFSYVLDFREANVIVALSVLPPLVTAIWIYRGELNRSALAICLAGAGLGLPLGLYTFSVVDEVWLIRVTGVLIFLLAAEGLWVQRDVTPTEHVSRMWTLVAGIASGILTGAVGMGGPPIAAFAARQPWAPRQIKVFLLSFTLLLSILRVAGLAATGWLRGPVLFDSLLAVPFALIGAHVGLLVSHNINAAWFRRLTMGALLLLSLGMILRMPKEPPSEAAESPGQAAMEDLPAFRSPEISVQ